MDCDVDLQKFADVPFVIERPAGENLLGSQAAKFLAKRGFRLNFGRGALTAKLAADNLGSILSEGTAVLDRQSAAVSDEHASAIVAMRARAPSSLRPDISVQLMQLDGLTMLGHSICGADRQEASTFAVMVAMQQKFDDAALVHFANADRTENSSEIDSSGTGSRLQDLIARREVVEAKLAFLGHGFGPVATLAKHSVATSGMQFASLSTDLDVLSHSAIDPKVESKKELDLVKYIPREFGVASFGPSYLNYALFNEKSVKEIQGLHPDLLSVVNRAREICPIAFEVVPDNGGLRDIAEQRRLTRAGKSKAKLGRHTIGHAIDLVPTDTRGMPNFRDMKGFDAIRDAMKIAANELGVPIQWGGNWKKLVDKPHFELERKVYPGPGEQPDAEAILTAFR